MRAGSEGDRRRPLGRVVLLSSPLLGAATWAPVAAELTRRGRLVSVAAYDGRIRTPHDQLAGMLEVVPDEPGLVLVPHGNAGVYVAALASVRRVAGVVFVDAGLPSGEAETPIAPDGLVDHLAGVVDEGTRAAVEREQRRLPLAYFRSTVPSPHGWQELPAAYLGFGDTYAT